MLFTAVTFIAFTALVAVIAWWRTRDDDLSTQDGYFLAGRSLTGPVIAGSLMLTNLSTEQLIGQTGQSFSTNMGPIAWEVTSAAALVILALVFLPRYLKMGLTTVPEFLENRYDSTTKRIVSIMFLLGYLLTYLPTVLYSGALVFAAFSGSHQDAIAKGMTWRKEKQFHQWTCPYIPIDPHDIGRTYDADVIRINSQSGKGGIGFLLQQNYGYNPPPKMREDLGYRVKDVSDHEHRELSVKEVLGVFENSYLNHTQPLNVPDAHFIQNSDGSITANVVVTGGGSTVKCTATGNGRLDAVATAIEQQTGMHFTLVHYSEHALDSDTNSRACSYVGLKWASGEETWGCGTHTDIIVAGIKALVSAINNK